MTLAALLLAASTTGAVITDVPQVGIPKAVQIYASAPPASADLVGVDRVQIIEALDGAGVIFYLHQDHIIARLTMPAGFGPAFRKAVLGESL